MRREDENEEKGQENGEMKGRQEEKGRRSKIQNPAWHSGHYYFVVKGSQLVTLHLFNTFLLTPSVLSQNSSWITTLN